MNEKLKKTLFFLRLTDEENVLSITHIACMVVLTKIAMSPSPSITEMGGLLVTLAAYYGKRHINGKKTKLSDEQSAVITKLQSQVTNLADKTGALATTIGMTRR
jgi:hypothetical protein